MASNEQLNLEDITDTKAWFMAFEAKCSLDKNASNEKTKTMKFISTVGVKSLKRITEICAPTDLTDMKYEDIKRKILNFFSPKKKLIIAERTKFFQTKQAEGETYSGYLAKLNNAAEDCEFDELATSDSPREQLILTQFIAGIQSTHVRQKILETNYTNQMSTQQTLNFVQSLDEIDKFCNESENSSHKGDCLHSEVRKSSGKPKQCKFCGYNWHNNLTECPARQKICNNCNKKGHFAKMCKQQKIHNTNDDSTEETAKEVSENNIYHSYECNQVSAKYQKVNINGKLVSMLEDSGASCTIISTRMLKENSLHLDQKRNVVLETYDGHQMKCVGEIFAEISFETKSMYTFIKVVECNKMYGLLGRDTLTNHQACNVDQDSSTTDRLPVIKGCEAHLKVKDNTMNKVCNARPVPLAMQEKVEKELARLVSRGVLKPCPPGGVKTHPQ